MINYQNGMICLKFRGEDFMDYLINQITPYELGMDYDELRNYEDELIDELNELDSEECYDTPLDLIETYCNRFNIHDFLGRNEKEVK